MKTSCRELKPSVSFGTTYEHRNSERFDSAAGLYLNRRPRSHGVHDLDAVIVHLHRGLLHYFRGRVSPPNFLIRNPRRRSAVTRTAGSATEGDQPRFAEESSFSFLGIEDRKGFDPFGCRRLESGPMLAAECRTLVFGAVKVIAYTGKQGVSSFCQRARSLFLIT